MKQLHPKGTNRTGELIKPKGFPGFFLIPRTGFYFLTVAIALVIFFIIWAILQETGDKSPWIYAGIFSSLILLSAVLLREFILRDARRRYLLSINKYKNDVKKASATNRRNRDNQRFSLQRNASILKLIEKESESAKFSKNLPEKHLKVFELCNEYLKLTEKELKKVEIGSTKWGAIKNGRKRIKDVHKHHLISWAAIESRRLTKSAKLSGSIAKKIETTQNAVLVLESALSFYPENTQLIESIEAVSDFASSIKVSHWIELAEKAAFKGQNKKAISHYKDALFYLARENVRNINKEEIAKKINSEIRKLRKLKSKN